MVVNIPQMKPVRNNVVNCLYTIPGPVQNWFVEQHEKCPRNTENDEQYKSDHAQKSQWTDKPSWEGEFESHEDSSVYSSVDPPYETNETIFSM